MEMTFDLNNEDAERVYRCKAAEGRADWTPNEYVAALVSRELRRMCPVLPPDDDDADGGGED